MTEGCLHSFILVKDELENGQIEGNGLIRSPKYSGKIYA